uniref:LSM domain-containing protein n=1 Tax=Oryzias melastigma TaxID=30732 RepID=A0A3B3BGJ1_ORYME
MEPEEAAVGVEVVNSIRERTIAENSMVVLLQGLQGEVTTVDLRDESSARGLVLNVDAFMNIRLKDPDITGGCRWTGAAGVCGLAGTCFSPGCCETSRGDSTPHNEQFAAVPRR